jgi:hypothetical protein
MYVSVDGPQIDVSLHHLRIETQYRVKKSSRKHFGNRMRWLWNMILLLNRALFSVPCPIWRAHRKQIVKIEINQTTRLSKLVPYILS